MTAELVVAAALYTHARNQVRQHGGLSHTTTRLLIEAGYPPEQISRLVEIWKEQNA